MLVYLWGWFAARTKKYSLLKDEIATIIESGATVRTTRVVRVA